MFIFIFEKASVIESSSPFKAQYAVEVNSFNFSAFSRTESSFCNFSSSSVSFISASSISLIWNFKKSICDSVAFAAFLANSSDFCSPVYSP